AGRTITSSVLISTASVGTTMSVTTIVSGSTNGGPPGTGLGDMAVLGTVGAELSSRSPTAEPTPARTRATPAPMHQRPPPPQNEGPEDCGSDICPRWTGRRHAGVTGTESR